MNPRITATNRCTPLAEWPQADQRAWKIALQPADLLEQTGGYALRWRPDSQKKVVNGYGRWLGWLARTGQLDPALEPGERVDRDRVRAYLQDLREAGLADHSQAGRLQELHDAMRAMASEGDWAWILRGAERIRADAVPARDLTSRMRPPEEIVTLGLDMMHAAENDRFRTDCDRATLFRDGLLVAFQTLRALRPKNLAGLTVQHLQERGNEWWVSFASREMKADEEHEFPWPEVLAEPLRRYLDVHRVKLLECGPVPRPKVDGLWVSRQGRAMGIDAIAAQIISRTEAEFGEGINPQTFRHIAATTIATATPDNIMDVAGVLGHSTLKTSEKHYNRARAVDAAQLYQGTIRAKRRRVR